MYVIWDFFIRLYRINLPLVTLRRGSSTGVRNLKRRNFNKDVRLPINPIYNYIVSDYIIIGAIGIFSK